MVWVMIFGSYQEGMIGARTWDGLELRLGRAGTD